MVATEREPMAKIALAASTELAAPQSALPGLRASPESLRR